MNKPIINPALFYLIELSDRFWLLFILLGIALFIIGTIIMMDGYLVDEKKFQKKPNKVLFIIGIIMIFISNLIPSKETCYKMMVTSYITPNNIELSGEKITELIDYLVDKINDLKVKEDK